MSNLRSSTLIQPNPLENVPRDVINQRKTILINNGLQDYKRYFDQAEILFETPFPWRDGELEHGSERCQPLSRRERESLDDDDGTIRKMLKAQPWAMWKLILLCGLGAMVQGWDEAAVNGAQVYYQWAYGINDRRILIGLINGAPYLCCFVSCWFSWPLNDWLGRRGTIFLAALCSVGFALGQAFANDWKTMFALRFCLGFGIGPKSATVPIYAAECSNRAIRGALVMMWQLFTALGIMFGYLSGVAFANVLSGNAALNHQCAGDLLSLECSLNWRLMIGSPMLAPLFLVLYVLFLPESPRWLIDKAQKAQKKAQSRDRDRGNTNEEDPANEEASMLYRKVFEDLNQLRGGIKIKAARDMMIIDILLWQQKNNFGSTLRSQVFKPRTLNAFFASTIVMFLQQFCGINVLIYYSTLLLSETGTISTFPGTGVPQFMVASFGVGAINFFFGLPAIFLIDEWGRRTLLLLTFPLLALFQAFVAIATINGLSPNIDTTVFILMGMYLFAAAYSPGEGPVPFVYASESFPQATRDIGMSVVTSINWIFNFTVAVSFPSMAEKMQTTGVFWFYSAFCLLGFWLIFFLVPETKGKELEKLDETFNMSIGRQIRERKDELRDTLSQASHLFSKYDGSTSSNLHGHGHSDIELRTADEMGLHNRSYQHY